ncbi:MAG: extracellular solute-binding protein [Clostridia bacterium]|nr:extracellular solute-binding protein [Clostridia bacterium]
MKKRILSLILCLFTIFSLLPLSACSFGGEGGGGGADGDDDESIKNVYAAYVSYASQNGDEVLSYESWLASIKGEKGEPGSNGANGLNGEDGKDGKDGKDGVGIKDITSELVVRDGKSYIVFTYYMTDNTTKTSEVCLGDISTTPPVDTDDPCESGHSFSEGKCMVCGEEDPDYIPEQTPDEPAGVKATIAQIIAGDIGCTYLTQGVVVATNAQSFLIVDETGLILVYMGPSWTPDVEVGDVLSVVATSSLYGYAVQLSGLPVYKKIGSTSVDFDGEYPLPLTPEYINSIANLGSIVPTYVEITGQLAISGSYYNLIVEGTDIKGSIATPIHEIAEALNEVNGEKITVVGFLTGITGGGRYLSIMLTDAWLDNDEPEPEPDTPNEPDDGKIHITFYHTMNAYARTILDKYVAEFEAMYPQYDVEHVQVGGYDDLRETILIDAVSGARLPNIAYCYSDHVALYNTLGIVKTLDEFMESEITVTRADGVTETVGLTEAQKADFISAFLNEGRVFGDGLTYMMPFSKSTELMYYNKTFFEANGLEVPTNWEEFEVLLREIKRIDPNCIPFGYDSEANWFITLCQQFGYEYTSATGEHYLFNNEDNKAFVKILRYWYEEGLVTTSNIMGSYCSNAFTSSNIYFYIGSSAGAHYNVPSDNGFEVGIASIPQADAYSSAVISQGPSLCVFEGSEEEMLGSWLFIKFISTSVELQAEFSMSSGYLPVIKSVMENEIYKVFLKSADGYSGVTALAIKAALEQSSSFFVSDAFVGSATAREEVGRIVYEAMCGLTQGAESVDEMIDRLFESAIKNCKAVNK